MADNILRHTDCIVPGHLVGRVVHARRFEHILVVENRRSVDTERNTQQLALPGVRLEEALRVVLTVQPIGSHERPHVPQDVGKAVGVHTPP